MPVPIRAKLPAVPNGPAIRDCAGAQFELCWYRNPRFSVRRSAGRHESCTYPNPNLKQIHTHEATASVERELWKGVSLRGLYVYKRVVGLLSIVNRARQYGVYDQVLTRKDPGPDGALNTADDGGLITFYDYNPAYRGTTFVSNTQVNATPGRDDWYHNVDISLNKRQSGGKVYAYTALLL